MNVLVFASSYRSYAALKNVCVELFNRKISTVFLYSTDTNVQYPTMDLSCFNFDSNVETDLTTGHFVKSLNIHLPFIPNVVLLARERWQPEQFIISEFKERYGSKVYIVEVSSHIVNNIENRLEMLSRDALHPQRLVDGYFEHSQFAKQRRIDCLYEEWAGKSIVVGNPRFDYLDIGDISACKDKYGVDPNKPSILFWGIINTSREASLDYLRSMSNHISDQYQIFYKPNPQEPTNNLFKHQFDPFLVPNVKVVYDDLDVNAMSQICDIHIATVSSVCQYAFYYSKKLGILNNVCGLYEKTNDLDRYTGEYKLGVEDSAKFWMSVFGLRSLDDFIHVIGKDRVKLFNQTNKIVDDIVQHGTTVCSPNMDFLNTIKQADKQFIKLFDEYSDGNASKRIVNYLQNNE